MHYMIVDLAEQVCIPYQLLENFQARIFLARLLDFALISSSPFDFLPAGSRARYEDIRNPATRHSRNGPPIPAPHPANSLPTTAHLSTLGLQP